MTNMPQRFFRNAARLLFLAAIAGGFVGSVRAQSAHTPAVGSAERKAILDVLRATCERDLKQTVIFKVTLLKVAGDWATARVEPTQPSGAAIDFRKTHYKSEIEEGAFDAEGEALLRRSGEKWTLTKWRFGASDTELSLWIEELGAPASLN